MNTAGLNTKNAPLLPSSTLLDRRWKEHDLLLHQYKVKALKGLPAIRPTFNTRVAGDSSPPSKRKVQSAKQGSNLNGTSNKLRPKTSKDINNIYGGSAKPKRPLFRPGTTNESSEKGNHRRKSSSNDDPDAISSKEKDILYKNALDNRTKSKQRPFTSKDKPPRPITGKPATAKKRPFTSKETSRTGDKIPIYPRRQGWVKSGGVRPIKSSYSRQVMDDHFRKHQYYRNHILHRVPIKRTFVRPYAQGNNEDGNDDENDGLVSSESSESSDANLSASPSPQPSATPSPPPKLEIEINLDELAGPDVAPLYFDDMPLFNDMPEKKNTESNEEGDETSQNQNIDGGDPDGTNNVDIDNQNNEISNENTEDVENIESNKHKNVLGFENEANLQSKRVSGYGNNGPSNRFGGPNRYPINSKQPQAQGTSIFGSNNNTGILRPDHLYYKSENFYVQPSNFYPINSDRLENFIPPSHIIKVVRDAEELSNSDWSTDEEPLYILRDGKPGKYVEKEGKFIRIDQPRSRKKMKREMRALTDESITKEKEKAIQHSKKRERHRRIAKVIAPEFDAAKDAAAPTSSLGEDGKEKTEPSAPTTARSDVASSLQKSNVKDAENKENENAENNENEKSENIEKQEEDENHGEEDMEIENAESALIEKVDGAEGDDELEDDDEDEEIDGMEESEEEEEEKKEPLPETKQVNFVETNNPNLDFDAKKLYDSDIDEYGRRKSRPRPSSSLYDMLPPLNPDPKIDEGDVNKCKVRLLRETVLIREAIDNPSMDSLEKAMMIIIKNNNDNRRWLRKLYRDEYLQSLLLDLRKNLPADIGSVISYMMIPVCEFDAMCLWDALKGLHKDPEVLSEILCTRNNTEMASIREAYNLRYGEEVLDHIEDETLGPFQRILMALAIGQRDETEDWSRDDANKEAMQIHALIEGGGHHLEKLLIELFTRRPIDMLRAIMNEYKKFRGHGLDVDLVKKLSKDFVRCIITIMLYIQNPPNYYCEKIHGTHYNGRCDDKTLCRIVISRSERDMEMIKGLFFLRYDMEIIEYVGQVCHGGLKGLVMHLIEHEVNNHPQPVPLLREEEKVETLNQISLQDAIKIILRKTKVVSKFIKLLHIRRERLRQADAESSDTAEEFELEPEDDQDEEKEQATQYDSAEEEERAAKEAQKELRDGLKNISFADNVQVEEIDPKHKSVFAEVSFAAASRGILKKTEQVDEEEQQHQGVEENVAELEDDLLSKKPNGPKMTQLNGPVLDPTFVSRDGKNVKKIGKAKKFRGTVKGVSMDQFNALKDAQAIGKAMLQKNRNVEGILLFLTTRNNAQRQLIIREFFRRYRRDLVDDLRVLAPQHEEITLSLLLSGEIYHSACLYAAVNGFDLETRKDTFIEILCSRQNDEIAIIKRAFKGIFSMDLEEEIGNFAHGNFRRLLTVIADCKRDEGDFVDEDIANKDSQTLYEALVKKPTNFDVFIEIFGTRSFPHIDAVCDNFSKITRVDILEIIDETLRGDFLEGIISIICNVRDAPMVFCERIYRSMAYDPIYYMLIRCVVSRAEIDLQLIKAAFRRTYGRTLYSMIDKDCDFPSKKILLSVVKK